MGEERKSKEESQLGDVSTKQGIWGAESPAPRAGDTAGLVSLSRVYFWIFLSTVQISDVFHLLLSGFTFALHKPWGALHCSVTRHFSIPTEQPRFSRHEQGH